MLTRKANAISYHTGKWKAEPTKVISEQSVKLTVNNEVWLTFMCTPIQLEALAIGFLYNEEIIDDITAIAHVRVCPGFENIDVWLTRSVVKPERWTRTSGCSGGKTRFSGNGHPIDKFTGKNSWMLSAEKVGALIAKLIDAQELYKQTGGVHTSAITDGDDLFITAEDIGRHNTLDKLAGRCFLEQIKPKRAILLTTGRISSEMMQKAHRLGCSVVISRTSPTSLSTQMAEELGITLIGYARRESFIVYAHPERLLTVPVEESITSEVK